MSHWRWTHVTQESWNGISNLSQHVPEQDRAVSAPSHLSNCGREGRVEPQKGFSEKRLLCDSVGDCTTSSCLRLIIVYFPCLVVKGIELSLQEELCFSAGHKSKCKMCFRDSFSLLDKYVFLFVCFFHGVPKRPRGDAAGIRRLLSSQVVRFSEPLRPQFRIINRTGHAVGLRQESGASESAKIKRLPRPQNPGTRFGNRF